MTSIWSTDDKGAWRLLAPKGFPDEATLHTMVEQAPQMLPLAGAPQLTVVGREVQLGSGYADLLAVEPDGRLVVIEVKLARNAEARRAVVAQVLTYAAFLRGMAHEVLEGQVLQKHLAARGYATLLDAANAAGEQTGGADAELFAAGLRDSLARGRFRLVFVLDEAPAELVRLVGYLEAVTDGLRIDLVTVSAYEVSGRIVLVPQRTDPEQPRPAPVAYGATSAQGAGAKAQGTFTEGAGEFAASVAQAPEAERARLEKLLAWAVDLEKQGLVTVGSFKGTSGRWTLLPRLPDEGVGLVTVWNDKGAYLQYWRSVFERRAPKSLPAVEALIAPVALGRGTASKLVTDELLTALTDAYVEAAAGIVLK